VTAKTIRPLADLDLPPGLLVWVAAARKGIEAHRYVAGQTLTPCRRNQQYGTTATAQDAMEQWAATACPRCWPEPVAAEQDNTDWGYRPVVVTDEMVARPETLAAISASWPVVEDGDR